MRHGAPRPAGQPAAFLRHSPADPMRSLISKQERELEVKLEKVQTRHQEAMEQLLLQRQGLSYQTLAILYAVVLFAVSVVSCPSQQVVEQRLAAGDTAGLKVRYFVPLLIVCFAKASPASAGASSGPQTLVFGFWGRALAIPPESLQNALVMGMIVVVIIMACLTLWVRWTAAAAQHSLSQPGQEQRGSRSHRPRSRGRRESGGR
eukprot:TRINITY_DN72292_c0_g1_i1.p1 TRINITY_DN72292_c0_g1~~TRINITY_DN72292_c0_g1_i1.p1  ORF type:complete len:205 (+),score=41.20 TRINITY_DN72292_c0_g1_i1:82-696(+)